MDIVRNDDGTLVVPVAPERVHEADDRRDRHRHRGRAGADDPRAPPRRGRLRRGAGRVGPPAGPGPRSRGVDRDRAAGGHGARARGGRVRRPRRRARRWPSSPIPRPAAEALRHVLVGGVHSVEDFAAEVAEAEGGDPLPAHEATKIIGQVLAQLD